MHVRWEVEAAVTNFSCVTNTFNGEGVAKHDDKIPHSC